MEGELVFGNIQEWLPQADRLAASGRIDLAQLSRVDSSGVAFLLELTRRAAHRSASLEFVNAAPQLRSLLEFLEIDGVLKLGN